jgi:MoxR-like ATPase
MARSKLFEGWSFKLKLPAPFDDPQYAGQKNMGRSKYNTNASGGTATLHAPSLRALLAFAKLVNASEQGSPTDDLGAIGHQDATYRIAEYVSANKTDCVVFNPTTGKFITGRFIKGSDNAVPYTMGAGNCSGSALLFCLMPVFDEDSEFHDCMADFKEAMASGWPDMDVAFETALKLCDNMYRRIENAKGAGKAGIKLAIPTTGNISNLSQLAINNGNYSPTGAVYGDFSILKIGSRSTPVTKLVSHNDFVNQYQMTQRILTDRERAMVPKLPDWYIIPHEVVRVCEHAKLTTTSQQPMRNFLFRGEAGTGKTMGAQAIAAGLNLPYTLMTCSANTEISDLVGQFIPDADGTGHDSCFGDDELPKVSDIIMHPPSVYMALTGVYDDDKTEDDVLEKLVEAAVARLAVKEEKQGQKIRYVDTPLIEAMRYGYVCELQEPSCIANPGVLVGLNSLLDSCQEITLPTGERVKRHPDTVIVVTTNSDYAGCRDMNQSIISRMDLIYDIAAPDLATMVKRVMNVTGFTDEQEATKMALVVRDIAERCRETMITDGSCGMREFKSWVLSTMITKDPYESALATIISSASADPDNRSDLVSTCLEKQYVRSF